MKCKNVFATSASPEVLDRKAAIKEYSTQQPDVVYVVFVCVAFQYCLDHGQYAGVAFVLRIA